MFRYIFGSFYGVTNELNVHTYILIINEPLMFRENVDINKDFAFCKTNLIILKDA